MKMIIRSGIFILSASLLVSVGAGLQLRAEASQAKFEAAFTPLTQLMSASSSYAKELFTDTFSDVPAGHWAYSSIMSAVKDGYVGGYPNGTFKPQNNVTRAEMIKMAISATGTATGKDTTKWYSSSVSGAKAAGWVVSGDFPKGDYNTPMTRLEMIKLAVRAVNIEAKTDQEYVLVAAQKGLISGTSKGLELEGVTTRAQSVVIVQRIMKLRSGGTLTADQNAVKLAMAYAKQQKDPWGQEIRTENLPKNFTDYPYILTYFPNKGYEMGTGNYGTVSKKPVEVFYNGTVAKVQYDQLKKNVEKHFDLLLNIDYRTVNGESWSKDFVNTLDNGQLKASTKTKLTAGIKNYIQWIKDNKIVTSGKAVAEVSTLREIDGTHYFMRVYYEFSVDSGNKSAIANTGGNYDSIFFGTLPSKISLFNKGYALGTKVKLVSEIELDFNSTKGWGDLNYYKVSPAINLAKNYIELK